MAVLIVDDSQKQRALIQHCLKKGGFSDLIPADCAKKAFEILKVSEPDEPVDIDLILLDIVMPEINGLEACRIIREKVILRDIPIIMVTGMKDTENLKMAFDAGAMDYINKPVEIDELLVRVRSLFRLKQEIDLRKSNEQQLRKVTQELQDTNKYLHQLAAELKIANKKAECDRESAERANRVKSEFLANMSHEIRTPMNAILGFSEILLTTTENSKDRRYLETIRSAGQTLLALINDILDLSKVESGKLKLEYKPVHIRNVVKDIEMMFLLKAKEKGIEISTEINPEIPNYFLMDEMRLRQILINLVGNAIKFTHRGYVKIFVYRSGDTGSNLIFEVLDTGIGIPKNQHEQIFEMFHQQPGQSAIQYGGTGLGLAIAKKLAHLMNGKITVESEVGKGCTFSLIFYDVAVAQPQDLGCSSSSVADDSQVEFESAVVLVVDDTPINRELITEYLSDTALHVMEAQSGEAALQLLESGLKPDLILMDIKMTGMTGYEAAQLIKTKDELKHIPCIAFTASALTHELEQYGDLFNGCLIKPVNKHQVISEMMKFLPHDIQYTSEKPKETQPCVESTVSDIREYFPEIRDRLNNEFIPRWEDIRYVCYLDDLADFARTINEFACKYGICLLYEYALNLEGSIQNNDIDKIEKLIAEFKEIIEQVLKKMLNAEC